MKNPVMPAQLLSYALSAFTLLTPLSAQVDTGTLTGTVRDSSGGVVAQARVSVRNEATAIDVELETNETGLYVSPPLRAGEYTITISAPGFERAAKRVQLDLSQRAVVDFDMKIGSITQEVSIVEATPLLQTESTTLSNLRTEKAIKDLPQCSGSVGNGEGVPPLS